MPSNDGSVSEMQSSDRLLRHPVAAPKPVFVYSGALKGQRYEAWREDFCRLFCRLDVAPTTADRIQCTLEISRVGSLSLGVAHGSAGSFRRTKSLLSDGCDDLVLLTAIEGRVLVDQRGHSIELQPSEMCLSSLSDIGESQLSEGGRYSALRIPRRDLMAACRGIEDKLIKPLAANAALRGVIAGYFALCAEAGPVLDVPGQRAMALHMTELVARLAETGENIQGFGESNSAARFQLVQAHVQQNLHDCGLTLSSVARYAGMSPRQVQRLFENSEFTFSEYVLEQRLQSARRLLVSARRQSEKISSIAYEVGFSDLSYFNRCFRKRFSITPSNWRGEQLLLSS